VRVPGPDTDPRETLQWVRKWEVRTGVASIALGLVLWNEGWWHWVLIGIGVLGVLPLSGAQAILRKAEKNPDVLISDPARRRARARRVAIIQPPVYAVFVGAAGYVMDGWPFGIFMAAFGGVCALGASWWILRRT
jgi:hypothetical protein